MLHPQNNSLEYSNGIAPPDGYELKYAVGTTYSLDLEALLLIPIAMIYASHIEKANGDLTWETISALSEVSNKIDIFCHKGAIHNPKKNNTLFAFWEQSIHEVQMDSHLQSFHPKVWIMQFENKNKEQLYKLFVTSKNLTASGDWDIAYSTEGAVVKEIQPDNKPLIEFVEYLMPKMSNKIPIDFLSNLDKVIFEKPVGWDKQMFFPIGISKEHINPVTKKKLDELLVISPFLDKTTVKELLKNNESVHLCSTQKSLDDIEASNFGTSNYAFNPIIEMLSNDETMFDEVDEQLLSLAMHAKLFVGKKGDKIFWSVGSANATSPAFEARNIEFNVELQTLNIECCPKQILKQLVHKSKEDKEEKLFIKYLPSKIKEDLVDKTWATKFRLLIHQLGLLVVIAKLKKSANGADYDMTINIDSSNISFEGLKVKIKPLSAYDVKAKILSENKLNTFDDFKNMAIANLSQFLIWEVSYKDEQKEFLTKMEIDIPYEERNSKILKSLFDTKEKLFKYINFLITNDGNEIVNTESIFEKKLKDTNQTLDSINIAGLPIYEKLLIAASRMPKKLDAIGKLIDSLGEDEQDENTLITTEFKEFWAEFIKYRNSQNETDK